MASDRYIEMKRDDELVMLCAKCYLFLGLEFGCIWVLLMEEGIQKDLPRFPKESRVIIEGCPLHYNLLLLLVIIELSLCIEIIGITFPGYWTS